MVNPTPTQFYATSHRGNRFGVEGPMYGPHGHLGQDFNGWAQGTIIPSWLSGQVVSTGWSNNLGWFVTVLGVISNGPQQVLRYVSFCHMNAKGRALGEIDFGDPIGPIGATGALAAGVHVHIPVAKSKILGGFDVEDPLPYITHAVGGTSTAGSSTQPLDQPKKKRNQTMQAIGMTSSGKTYSVHDDGRMEHHEDNYQRDQAVFASGQTEIDWLSDQEFDRRLYVNGLKYELDHVMVAAWPAGHVFRPSWMNPGRPVK